MMQNFFNFIISLLGVSIFSIFFLTTVQAKEEKGSLPQPKSSEVSPNRQREEKVVSQAGRVFFSPNRDGIIDAAIFKLTVSNPENIAEWEFKIRDSQAREVKRLKGKGAPPPTLEWNGMDENNQLIPDGIYHYWLSILTLAGTQVKIPPQELICDRQTPAAKISVEPSIFSAEEGSAKPTANFYMDGSDASTIHSWLLKIVNQQSGLTAKTFHGKEKPPASIQWNGRSEMGEPAPDGDYLFTLAVRDRAGNTTITSPQKLTIDRKEPLMQVQAIPVIFSPNADGLQDLTVFEIVSPPSKKVIEQWSLTLANSKGKTIQSFEGRGEPPRTIPWDGKDRSGRTVEDQAYSYQLVTHDQAGNRGLTVPKTLIVDNTPPQASVELKPALLSPNGDGFGDSGTFELSAKDQNGIASHALEIKNDVGDIRKVFTNQESPASILQWAVQEEGGGILIDGKYSYSLSVIDRAGNKTLTPPKPFQVDTSPPVVRMLTEPKLISPNGDYKEAIFQISVQDASEIESWTLKIEDDKKRSIRKFAGASFLSEPLSWDGKNEKGELVNDGSYGASFWVSDKAKNATFVPPQIVTVGAKIPEISISAKLPNFSPNADGIKDQNNFSIKFETFNKIRQWFVQILDASGVAVRQMEEFQGLGSPPNELLWNGKRDDKSQAPDGIYSYLMKVVDEAGNKNQTAPQKVQLDTARPIIEVRVSPSLFSPNANGIADETLFYLSYQDASPASNWSLLIKNEANKLVRTISGSGPDLPRTLSWDGKGDGNKILPDGAYTYTLAAEDAVGNKAVTLEQILKLDTTPPELTLSCDPKIFAPKSESAKNSALFQITAKDASNIAQWRLEFLNSKAEVVQKIQGENRPPLELRWEGTNEKNAVLPDDLYTVMLVAKDEVGNEGKSEPVSVRIDTLKPLLAVAPEEELVPSLMPEIWPQEGARGIVINLAAEILFETAKAEIRPVATPTLDEAAAIIKKYPERKVLVEGHTDNVPIKTQEFPSNQELSEARAKAIMDYFVKMRKIDAQRFQAKGYADKRPVVENNTPENRQKNRRVEIVILKPMEKATLNPSEKALKE